MTVTSRKIVLGLGFLLAFGACGEELAGPDNLPDSVVKEGVRFQAAAVEGNDPHEVTLQMELLNTHTLPRDLTWGGCGITIRLYRSKSLVYDSQLASGACDDIGHATVVHPAQVKVLTESILIDGSQVSAGRYDAVMVFKGEIDNARVALEVRAGSIDL